MAKISTVGPEAKERLQKTGKSYLDRAPYRDVIADLSDGHMLESELDAGETVRKLKLTVRRAANEIGRDIQYGETDQGSLLVWIPVVRTRGDLASGLLVGSCAITGTFAKFPEKLIRSNKKRILAQHAAHDRHRVGAQDVHQDAAAKLGGVIQSYDGIAIPRQDVVQASLILHQIVDPGPILQRPLHVRHQASERVSRSRPPFQHLLDECQHGILIEVPLAQVGLVPGAQLELTARDPVGDVDACGAQAA